MKKQILAMFFAIWALTTEAQMYVNKMWENDFGTPDSVAWSASTIDGQGNMIVVGNTIGVQGNAGVLTTYYDAQGNMVWQDIYNHLANGNDYGIAVTTDINGAIYVAGAVTDATGLLDWIVRKYDINGSVIWTQFYNHVGYDAPTAIVVSATGDVFVTGISTSLGTQADYLTIKYAANGTQDWAQSYDYLSLSDISVGITLDNNGNVIVTGGSQSAANSADYCTLKYDTNGTLLNTDRQTVAGTGMDKPTAIARDNLGNFIVTGLVQNAGNTDIRTIKFDNTFAFQWAQTYDKAGLEDTAKAIATDASGNIFITGYSTDSLGNRQIVVIKYNPTGNQEWVRNWQYITKTGSFPTEAAEIVANAQGNIYIAGTTSNASNTDAVMIEYNTNGNIKWLNHTPTAGNQVSQRVHVHGNKMYALQTQENNGVRQYVALKYEGLERTQEIVLNAQNEPSHVKNELIIRFSSTAAILNLFLDSDKVHGKLKDFIQPNVITLMEDKLGMNGMLSNAKTVKQYPFLTIRDSISYSRLGEKIHLEAYWATLILLLPDNNNLTGQSVLSEQEAGDSLSTLKPYIFYATPNHVYSYDISADDPLYSSQPSLYTVDPLIPGHINIEEAWDYTTGAGGLIVGIYDSGISWGHPDFSINGDQSWDNCVIRTGYNFDSFTPIDLDPINYQINDPVGHGTKCAGVIGACRNNIDAGNNGIGVAGIAGGDCAGLAPQTFNGALMDMMAMGNVPTSSEAAAAIFLGTLGGNIVPTGVGWGEHVMNHSWGGPSYNPLLRDAINEAYQHKVVSCTARGNAGTNIQHFPASLNSSFGDWLIAVGATNELLDKNPTASYEDIDVSAPSVAAMIETTILNDTYGDFINTSAATPHVAGTAGLLISYFSDLQNPNTHNLVPEDVEFLLEQYSKHNAGVVVPDPFIGWGVIDAGNTLRHLDKSTYDILHISTPVSTADYNYVTTQVMTLEKDIMNGVVVEVPAGNYTVDVYRVDINVDATASIPVNWGVINSWGVSCMSDFFPDFTNVTYDGSIYPREYHIDFVQDVADLRKGTITGYAYQFSAPGFPYDNYILPNGVGAGNVYFSVHIESGAVNIGEAQNTHIWKLYPNPSSNSISITYPINATPQKVEIRDLAGRLVKTVDNSMPSNNSITFNIEDLSPSIYICGILHEGKMYYQKFVKI